VRDDHDIGVLVQLPGGLAGAGGRGSDDLGRAAVAQRGNRTQHLRARRHALAYHDHRLALDIDLRQHGAHSTVNLLQFAESQPRGLHHLLTGQVMPAGRRLNHADATVLIDRAHDLGGQARCGGRYGARR
jgi:hypothetical protein